MTTLEQQALAVPTKGRTDTSQSDDNVHLTSICHAWQPVIRILRRRQKRQKKEEYYALKMAFTHLCHVCEQIVK